MCTAGLWLATAVTAATATAVAPVAHAARLVLALKLDPARNPPPSLGHLLALASHNIQVAGWPLLLAALGAHRCAWSRSLADVAVVVNLAVNGILVGLALGAYRVRLLPYLPQLPLEWAGLAIGPAGWIMARRQTKAQRVFPLAVPLVLLLTFAAAIETLATPHR
jgi:hypothetical protein